MELFRTAKVFKLRSHLGTYMVADEDKLTVRQSQDGSSPNAKWLVEVVQGKASVIRLRSFCGMYLTATTDVPSAAGEKVVQTGPEIPPNPKVDWEVIRDGDKVKLKNWRGELLQANGGTALSRNSNGKDRLKSQALSVKRKKPWFVTPFLPRFPLQRGNRRSLATAAQPNSPVKLGGGGGGGSSSSDNSIYIQRGSP